MSPPRPATLNGVPVPHDAPLEELLEQMRAEAPACGPAFIALGCRSDPQAFFALLEATKEQDWQKRRLAAAALRFHPMGKRALPALELLVTDEVPQVACTACETMGELGLMSERLIYLLQLTDPKVRAAALTALTRLGQRQLFSYVLKVFERETFPEPREAAAAFLMQFADESNWRELFRCWSRDVQPVMRARACALANRFATADDLDLVNDLLEDKDPAVRKAAYEVIVKMGS
ncbi:MAG: hypothetical protein Kow0059_18560 [Candidatus Sumerlaeia bacterium]